MQDRISPNSNKSSCNARPDHTFGSGADITRLLSNVRLTPESRQTADAPICPLRAKSRHCRFQLPGERLAMMLTTLNVITTSPA
jgi:hypothetical protein